MASFVDFYIFSILTIFFLLMNLLILRSTKTLVILILLSGFFYGLYYSFSYKYYLSLFIIIISIVELIFILSLTNITRLRIFFENGFFKKKEKSFSFDREKLILIIKDAFKYLAKEGCGALILIQNNDDLSKKYDIKYIINAQVTSAILKCIFYENNFLHDGAIIIKNNIIYAANVFIKCKNSDDFSERFGGRHTAAFNASKETDATVIVLSEEKKIMKVFKNGKELEDQREIF